ncbi:MAG: hypothetical protein L0Z52_12775 [Acidobacteria bacterium]|nr:hypothetical protein [Acidobacteriota bacterium]
MNEKATITCPVCGQQTTESMPENACVHFFKCPRCLTLLRPKPGECCVFCSYASVLCPPRRHEGGVSDILPTPRGR